MDGRIRDGFFKIYLCECFTSDDLVSSAHFEAKLAYERGIVIFPWGLIIMVLVVRYLRFGAGGVVINSRWA